MIDFLAVYLIIIVFAVLIGIVLFQAIERYLFARQSRQEKDKLLEEMSRLVKAVISKNANDYVMTASIDKVPTEEKLPTDPDLVPEEQLTDEEFMDSIGKGKKK
jgi:hypothetical protein